MIQLKLKQKRLMASKRSRNYIQYPNNIPVDSIEYPSRKLGLATNNGRNGRKGSYDSQRQPEIGS